MGITLNLVLAAFGGGAFGAALGALPAFCLLYTSPSPRD